MQNPSLRDVSHLKTSIYLNYELPFLIPQKPYVLMFCRDALEMLICRAPQQLTSCRMNISIINVQKSTVQTFWQLQSLGVGLKLALALLKRIQLTVMTPPEESLSRSKHLLLARTACSCMLKESQKNILSNFPLVFQT